MLGEERRNRKLMPPTTNARTVDCHKMLPISTAQAAAKVLSASALGIMAQLLGIWAKFRRRASEQSSARFRGLWPTASPSRQDRRPAAPPSRLALPARTVQPKKARPALPQVLRESVPDLPPVGAATVPWLATAAWSSRRSSGLRNVPAESGR